MSFLCVLKHQGKGRPVDTWSGPLAQVSQTCLTCYPEDSRAISPPPLPGEHSRQSGHLATDDSFAHTAEKTEVLQLLSSSCANGHSLGPRKLLLPHQSVPHRWSKQSGSMMKVEHRRSETQQHLSVTATTFKRADQNDVLHLPTLSATQNSIISTRRT